VTLAPLENRNVRGVAAERYPLNPQCSNPECDNATDDPHHIFRRRLIGSDSWFVEITNESHRDGSLIVTVEVIPHVTGLCRECHDKVTDHRFWIKLEGDEFVLYEREDAPVNRESEDEDPYWRTIGPLSPQPGGRDKPARRRKRKEGEERRKRRTISLRVPDDTEDGGAIWDELLDEVKARLIDEGLYSEGDKIPNYEALVAALRDWLNGWIRNG
jgi:hypothetical protein